MPAETRKRRVKRVSISVAVVAFIIVQMIWDISANDLAAYVQPLFTKILGAPPTP